MGSGRRGESETISHRARSLQGIRFRPSLHERLSSPSSVERTRKGGALRSLGWGVRPFGEERSGRRQRRRRLLRSRLDRGSRVKNASRIEPPSREGGSS